MKRLLGLTRALPLLLASALLLANLAAFYPENLFVINYKLSMVILSAFAGYWIDRLIFPYHRICADKGVYEDVDEVFFATIRRVVIVAITVLGVAVAA